MSSIYVWVVADEKGQTLVTRSDRYQAKRNLDYFRSIGTRCSLILETTEGSGWRLESTEQTIIGIDEQTGVAA